MFPHLALQFFVEGGCSCELYFPLVLCLFGALPQVVGNIVIIEVVAQCIVFRRERVVVVVVLVVFRAVIVLPVVVSRFVVSEVVRVLFLQGGVVHHFVLYALCQFGDRQLHHFRHRHL